MIALVMLAKERATASKDSKIYQRCKNYWFAQSQSGRMGWPDQQENL